MRRSSKKKYITTHADGPTSVILINKNAKKPLKLKLQSMLFKTKKNWIAKSIKAEFHTIDQVIEYAKSRWGYLEVSNNSEEYRQEYKYIRDSLIQQYSPDLLGEWKECPSPESMDKEDLNAFLILMDKWKKEREQAIENISKELFDIDLTVLELTRKNLNGRLILEKKYNLLSSSATGKKNMMKKYNKILRDIYRFYGVTQEDIDTKSNRYKDLLFILSDNR